MSIRPRESPKEGTELIRALIQSAAEQGAKSELTFEDLTETEKTVASLGVAADDWKPIGWVNAAHYAQLLQKNAISGDLTQKIEAYRHVATQE